MRVKALPYRRYAGVRDNSQLDFGRVYRTNDKELTFAHDVECAQELNDYGNSFSQINHLCE